MRKRNFMKPVKAAVAALMCAAICIPAAACGGGLGGGSGRTKGKSIKFLHIWPEHASAIQKVVNDFMAENEDIDINVQISSYSEIQQSLNMNVVSQSLPDVFFYWTNQIQGYIDAGVLLDLSPYTEGWLETYVGDGAPSWGLARRGDAYYSVPLRQSGNVIVYNKTLFEENDWEIPSTYQEFESLLAEARNESTLPSYCPVAVSGTNGGYLIDFYYMLNNFNTLLQEGYNDPYYKSALVDDSGEKDIEYTAKQLDKIADLYKKGYFGQAEGKSDATAVRNFKEGTAAMVYMNYNNINLLGDVDFEYGYFSVPGPEGMDYRYIRADYDGFCVAKNTKNAEACIRFLKYLTSKEVITEFANATNSIVPVKDVTYTDPLNAELAQVLNGSGDPRLIQNEVPYSSGGIQNDVVELIYDTIYGKSAYTTTEVARRISALYATCISEQGFTRHTPQKPLDETKDYSWLNIRT